MSKKSTNAQNKVSIGGQAVIEGVMMRGKTSMATAVRDQDGVIRLETKRLKPKKKKSIKNWPIIRGVVSFVDSFYTGTKVLMRSADVFGEGEPSKTEKWLADKLKVNVMSVVSTISLLLGLVLAVGLFIILPQTVRVWLVGEQPNVWAKNFIEGGLKLVIFVLYIFICGLIKDVKRTFMYHGAEHKTISCYEKGLPLTVENAKKCSRLHNRCGTTFMFFVILVSILVFAGFEALVGDLLTVGTPFVNKLIRILCKIAFLPIVAGLSYELLKFLAKTDCFIFVPLKVPGLLIQTLSTREPDENMLEVAITAFNTVLKMDEDQTIPEQNFATPLKRREVLMRVVDALNEHGIEEVSEAEWIVSLTLGVKRSQVRTGDIVSVSKVEEIDKIVKERVTGRPLWYVLGSTDFYGHEIKVDESVLIPRPETEILCENAIKVVDKNSKVLDLCTGSGAIALTIKKAKDCEVTASDVSEKALDIAKENFKTHGVEINTVLSDMFSAVTGKFDVIVSNPPYIKSDDINSLQKEVKDFEPLLALDGGEDGLKFYKIIADKARDYLNDNGVIFLEVGINQAEDVKALFTDAKSVEIIKDYENIDRIVKVVY